MSKVSPGCVFRTFRKVHRKSSKSGSTNKWKRNFPEPKREWPLQRPKLELTILRINLSVPHHKSSAAVSAIPFVIEAGGTFLWTCARPHAWQSGRSFPTDEERRS